MQSEYIIAFSSFYKAAYAQDLLGEAGIKAVLRKLPIEIAKSCSTGLVLKGDSVDDVKKVFRENSISTRGIYLVDKISREKTSYKLVR